MDLRSMLLFAAERNPDKTALVDGAERLTYREWAERVWSLADALAMRGVGRGDRVAIGMRNTIDHCTAYFALMSLGAVAVSFNFRFKPAGLVYMFDDSEVKAALVDDPALKAGLERIHEPARRLLWVVSRGEAGGAPRLGDLVREGRPQPTSANVSPDDLSAILYTSGTTGQPKGVPLTHRMAYSRFLSYLLSAGLRFGAGTRTLGAAPLYHTVGLHFVFCLSVFLNGAYYPVSELDGFGLMSLIEHEKINFLFGSPTLFHVLAGVPGHEKFDLSHVTDVSYGSAPMPPSLLRTLGTMFPRASICEVYGTTEIAVPFVTYDAPSAPTGALRVTADHRVRVVSPGGDPDAALPPHEEGELIVDITNEGAFTSYWNKPEKSAERIRERWYYTGDAFSHDGRGNFFINGRIDDMFISGGENIQPVEIEQVLSAHPGIADLAIIGTPHARWGEAVTALVVKRDPGLTEEDIDNHCLQSDLPDFKRPRRVIFVDAIERNPSGKLVRAELRQRYAQEVQPAT
jgi:2-furoate---CoA ligase